jgi:hypothetical protein
MQAQSVMVILLGNLTQPPGIAARELRVQGLRISPAMGLHQLPVFGDVNVAIAGNGRNAAQVLSELWNVDAANLTNLYVPLGNRFATIPTAANINLAFTSANPNNLLVARFADHAVEFDPTGGNAGNISTIAAGWLAANSRTTGRPGLGGTGAFTAGQPPAASAGQANTRSVVLRELVPNSGWFNHSITFTLVDAAGEVLPYAAIESVAFVTSSAESRVHWGRDSAGVVHPIHTGTGAPPAGTTSVQSGVTGNFYNTAGTTLTWVERTAAGNPLYPNIGAVSGVTFHPGGQSVTVSGLTLTHAAQVRGDTLSLFASFAITADVGYTGPVYVAVEGPALIAGQVVGTINNPQLQLTNVRPSIMVDTTITPVQIGFQEIDVADITISEYAVGDFRTGGTLALSLGEYGVGQIAHQVNNLLFVPIPAGAIAQHMSVGGSSVVQQRAIVAMDPFHIASETLTIRIQRQTQGDTPSYIELTGLQVRASRNVPYGDYQLVVRGTSVLNNEDYRNLNVGVGGLGQNIPPGTIVWFNPATGSITTTNMAGNAAYQAIIWQGGWIGGGNFVMPNQPGFDRFGHSALMVDYVRVITPGAGAETPVERTGADYAAVAWGAGGSFTANGETVSFADAAGTALTSINRNNRLYVPLRSVIETLGGEIMPIFDPVTGAVTQVVTRLPGATFQYVTWTIGSVAIQRDGSTWAVTTAPFIEDAPGTANHWSTFLPLRGISEAHGLYLHDATDPSIVSFNPIP